MIKNVKYKDIMSLNMANYLIMKGSPMIKVRDDKKNSAFKVFVFEETDKLLYDMSIYNK